MPTSGAYRLFAWYSEQDVSPGHVLFVQNKQAVSPQSGHQPLNGRILKKFDKYMGEFARGPRECKIVCVRG
jgi:hypothetical protein